MDVIAEGGQGHIERVRGLLVAPAQAVNKDDSDPLVGAEPRQGGLKPWLDVGRSAARLRRQPDRSLPPLLPPNRGLSDPV